MRLILTGCVMSLCLATGAIAQVRDPAGAPAARPSDAANDAGTSISAMLESLADDPSDDRSGTCSRGGGAGSCASRVACRMSHVVCRKSRARKKRQPPHQVRKLVSLGEMRDEGGERKKRRRRKRRRTFVGMLQPTPPEFVASRGRGPPCLL